MSEKDSELNPLRLSNKSRSIAQKVYELTQRDAKEAPKKLKEFESKIDLWPYNDMNTVSNIVDSSVDETDVDDGELGFEKKTESNKALIKTVKQDIEEQHRSETTKEKKPSRTQIRKRILSGEAASEISSQTDYSTYMVKKMAKNSPSDKESSSESIPPLTYDTDTQEWQKEQRSKEEEVESEDANNGDNDTENVVSPDEVDNYRQRVLNGEPVTKIAEDTSHSTYKIRQIIKGDSTHNTEKEDTEELKYADQSTGWVVDEEDSNDTDEKEGSETQNTTSKETPTQKLSTDPEQTDATDETNTDTNREKQEKTPLEPPKSDKRTAKKATTATNDINGKDRVTTDKLSKLKDIYGEDVVSISESLYACFIEYREETKYKDIIDQHENRPFPLRQKTLHIVKNTSGKTRLDRISSIASWVDGWYDDPETVREMNSKTRKPMGMP